MLHILLAQTPAYLDLFNSLMFSRHASSLLPCVHPARRLRTAKLKLAVRPFITGLVLFQGIFAAAEQRLELDRRH
jgi:hypothetical protein